MPRVTTMIEFSARTKEIHGRLAAVNKTFLEHIERCPQLLERPSFAALDQDSELVLYRLQSWPTFLDAATVAEVRRVNGGITELIKSVPERFFNNDAARIEEFYGYQPDMARMMLLALEQRQHLENLFSRGDFIHTESGFQCLEINLMSNVGGWATAIWAELYQSIPAISDFLQQTEMPIAYTNTARIGLAHLIEAARKMGLDGDGELNLALAVPGDNRAPRALRDFGERQYLELLREIGGTGSLVVCAFEEMEERDERLYAAGKRIHMVLEHYDGVIPRHVLFPWLAGNVLLVNGLVSRILDDRRNLALLSEYQESDYLDAHERQLIRDHVPWTRSVSYGYTTRGDERVLLPDDLLVNRERMVLKHIATGRGQKIVLGAQTAPHIWESAVEQAIVENGSWIVQERVASLPYWFQQGVADCGPHDVVWGFFLFGDRYGGGFLRMMPSDSHGVINAARGAEEGILFEVA